MKKNGKIFVAGHRGLVGSEILKTLKQQGYKNIITKSHKKLDLMNQKQTKKFFKKHRPDYIFLSAAKVGGIIANSTYPAEFIYNNLMIELNIIHYAYKYGVKKLVFLASSCVYPKFANQPMKESELLGGYLEETNISYAIAKIAGIVMCNKYNEQYGTKFISLMPTNLYGSTCFSSDTDVLTPDGIKNIKDCKIGDDIYTLNPKNHNVEIEKIISNQITTTNEFMNFKTKTCDFKVTPDHKIYFKTRTEYPYIKRDASIFKKRLMSKRGGILLAHHKPIYEGKEKNIDFKNFKDEYNIIRDDGFMKDGKHSRFKYYPTDYDLMDLCKFIGWYVSEGSIVDKMKTKYSKLDCGQIRITQSLLKNPDYYEEIDNLLKRMGIYYGKDSFAFYFTSRSFKTFIRNEIGVGSKNKKIPKFIFELPLEYRKVVFENLIKGDGTRGYRRYTTKSDELKNDFIHLCFTLGIRIGNVNNDGCWRIFYRGDVRNELFVGYKNMWSENIDNEKVYCVTTEKNHIIYAGRNNKFNWIGQCDNYDLEKSHVLPAMIRKFHEAKKLEKSSVELWGTGSPMREFLHVKDMAEATIFCMLNYEDYTEHINIGTGTDVTIKQTAEIVKDVVGYEGEIIWNIEKPDGTPRKLLDVSKINNLGWKHSIDIEEGIRMTYHDLLEKHPLFK
jgi:nucleoside-diphosphate-sugar epimerase